MSILLSLEQCFCFLKTDVFSPPPSSSLLSCSFLYSGAAGANEATGPSGEPADNVNVGGSQGTGTFPFRPLNILDTWHWNSNGTGVCKSGQTCPDKTGIGDPIRVWTYDGGQAEITPHTDIVANGESVWGDAPSASSVDPVTADLTNSELPVLCFVGEGYVNHNWWGGRCKSPEGEKNAGSCLQWTAGTETTHSWLKRAGKPTVGYSPLVRCMDTSDFTVDEARLDYSPQSQKNDKFVFVNIIDQNESPTYVDEALETQTTVEIEVDENNAVDFNAYGESYTRTSSFERFFCIFFLCHLN